MESVNERTKEFIVRCIGRNASQRESSKRLRPIDQSLDSGRPLTVFEAYEVVSEALPIQAGPQSSPRGRMALQEYRKMAVLDQARG